MEVVRDERLSIGLVEFGCATRFIHREQCDFKSGKCKMDEELEKGQLQPDSLYLHETRDLPTETQFSTTLQTQVG